MEEKKAIAFTAYKRADGFEISLTFRGDSGTEVLELMDKALTAIKEKGGTPVFKNKFPPKQIEYVEGRLCPKDSGRLVYATKKDGEKFIKCENNKWNKLTQRPEGCDFIEWPKSKLLQKVEDSFERLNDEAINVDDINF